MSDEQKSTRAGTSRANDGLVGKTGTCGSDFSRGQNDRGHWPSVRCGFLVLLADMRCPSKGLQEFLRTKRQNTKECKTCCCRKDQKAEKEQNAEWAKLRGLGVPLPAKQKTKNPVVYEGSSRTCTEWGRGAGEISEKSQ